MTTANPPIADSTIDPPSYRLKIHSTKLPINPHIGNQNKIPPTTSSRKLETTSPIHIDIKGLITKPDPTHPAQTKGNPTLHEPLDKDNEHDKTFNNFFD